MRKRCWFPPVSTNIPLHAISVSCAVCDWESPINAGTFSCSVRRTQFCDIRCNFWSIYHSLLPFCHALHKYQGSLIVDSFIQQIESSSSLCHWLRYGADECNRACCTWMGECKQTWWSLCRVSDLQGNFTARRMWIIRRRTTYSGKSQDSSKLELYYTRDMFGSNNAELSRSLCSSGWICTIHVTCLDQTMLNYLEIYVLQDGFAAELTTTDPTPIMILEDAGSTWYDLSWCWQNSWLIKQPCINVHSVFSAITIRQ